MSLIATHQIPSETSPGVTYTIEIFDDGISTCTCPSWQKSEGSPLMKSCKHIRDNGLIYPLVDQTYIAWSILDSSPLAQYVESVLESILIENGDDGPLTPIDVRVMSEALTYLQSPKSRSVDSDPNGPTQLVDAIIQTAIDIYEDEGTEEEKAEAIYQRLVTGLDEPDDDSDDEEDWDDEG